MEFRVTYIHLYVENVCKESVCMWENVCGEMYVRKCMHVGKCMWGNDCGKMYVCAKMYVINVCILYMR
jgi:hypothetical protein